MKFTLDTQNKTITLLEEISLDELIALHADYKLQGYKVIPNIVSYINYQYTPYVYPTYTPWQKPTNPWNPITITSPYVITGGATSNTLNNMPLTTNNGSADF